MLPESTIVARVLSNVAAVKEAFVDLLKDATAKLACDLTYMQDFCHEASLSTIKVLSREDIKTRAVSTVAVGS